MVIVTVVGSGLPASGVYRAQPAWHRAEYRSSSTPYRVPFAMTSGALAAVVAPVEQPAWTGSAPSCTVGDPLAGACAVGLCGAPAGPGDDGPHALRAYVIPASATATAPHATRRRRRTNSGTSPAPRRH